MAESLPAGRLGEQPRKLAFERAGAFTSTSAWQFHAPARPAIRLDFLSHDSGLTVRSLLRNGDREDDRSPAFEKKPGFENVLGRAGGSKTIGL